MRAYVITKCNSFEHLKFSLKMAQYAPKHVEEKVIINICIFIVYVHFVILKTIFEQMNGMESFKISDTYTMNCGAR